MAYESPTTAKSGSEGDFMATARKRIKIAIEATDENRKHELDDIKFAAGSPDNGWQWPPAILQARQNPLNAGGPRPCLTINKLPQHIRLVTNEQRQNRPSIKVLPVDDKGDVEVAEILNGMIRHIETNSDADVAYDTAGENQVTCGEGYWRVLTDYVDEKSFDQDILIAPIRNAFSVYMDPDGLRRDSTGRFIQWCFITDQLEKDEFKRQFPNAAEINWDEVGRGDDELRPWFEDGKVRIAEYFYFKEEKKKIVLWADGSVTLDGEMPKVAGLKSVKERTTSIKKVQWCKINGLEELESREWAGKFIPVVRIAGNEWEVEGKQIVAGIVRNAKDAQRMGNYWESQDAEMLALQPKAPFVGTPQQFEGFEDQWQQANSVNYAYLKYNAHDENGNLLPPPKRQEPPMVAAGFVAAKLQAWDNLQATVGQYNPSIGAEADEKSGKAIMARQRQADVGTYHFIDNQGRGIRQTGRILIDLIPKIYDTKRVARIIGEDGEPDHVTIDPEQTQAKVEITGEDGGIEKIYNPTIGNYDVRVTVGPSYTTKRQEAAEFMAQVLSGNKELMQIMGDLYFKMLDVPGADEISERLKKALPPGLAADEEDDPEPIIPTPQGPLPASQVPQVMQEMAMQLEQAGEAVKAAGDMEQEAHALEKLKLEVKAAASKLEADRREFELRVQVAEAEAKCMGMEAQNKLRDEKTAIDEEMRGREEAVKTQAQEQAPKPQSQPVNVIDSSVAGPLSEVAQSTMMVAQAIGQQSQAIAELARVSGAPRRNRMTLDGEEIESVSELVQ